MAATLLVGLPAGVVLGRWVVELVTNTLGIVPGTDVPVLVLLAMSVAVVAMANLLSLMPARHRPHQGRGAAARLISG